MVYDTAYGVFRELSRKVVHHNGCSYTIPVDEGDGSRLSVNLSQGAATRLIDGVSGNFSGRLLCTNSSVGARRAINRMQYR